jgi:hypothetical protein
MCLAAATTRGETRRPQAYVGGLPTPNKAERPLETQTTGWLLHTALGFGPGWAIGGRRVFTPRLGSGLGGLGESPHRLMHKGGTKSRTRRI